MIKRAVFGGSFDPIHLGHLNLAGAVISQLELDELLLVPAANSPLKPGLKRAGDEDRLAMCRLAARGRPRITVSDFELAQGGVSYTYKTVEHFSAPGEELFLVVGADALLTLQDWKYPQLILQRVIVVGGCRSGDAEERKRLTAQADFLAALGFGVKLAEYEPLPVSSTEVRKLIADGKSTQGLLDPAVRQYIDDKKLYIK